MNASTTPGTATGEPIQAQLQGTTYHILLDRPDCGNLVTSAMVDLLHRAVTALLREAQRLVLYGASADFCKGRDYNHAPERGDQGRAPTASRSGRTWPRAIAAVKEYLLAARESAPDARAALGRAY